MTDFTPEDYIKYRIDRAKESIGYFGSICASVFGVVSASDSGPNCAII